MQQAASNSFINCTCNMHRLCIYWILQILYPKHMRIESMVTRNSRSSILSQVVVERKLRYRGDDSPSYVVPDDVTVDILSAIQMRFGLVRKRYILRYVQCFAVGRWIQYKAGSDVRGKPSGKKTMKESEYSIIYFYFRFFLCNLLEYCTNI